MTCVHVRHWLCQFRNGLQIVTDPTTACMGRPAIELDVLYVSHDNRYVVGLYNEARMLAVRAPGVDDRQTTCVLELHSDKTGAMAVAAEVVRQALNLPVSLAELKRDRRMSEIAATALDLGTEAFYGFASEMWAAMGADRQESYDLLVQSLHTIAESAVMGYGDDQLVVLG